MISLTLGIIHMKKRTQIDAMYCYALLYLYSSTFVLNICPNCRFRDHPMNNILNEILGKHVSDTLKQRLRARFQTRQKTSKNVTFH